MTPYAIAKRIYIAWPMKKIIDKFLFWLTDFLPCRLINDGELPYLERYYIGTMLGWRFYFHRFVGSDPDLGLHDHPWRKAYSLILSGWYYEHTRQGVRKVRWFNSLVGDNFHRVVLPGGGLDLSKGYGRLPEIPCWTLFFHTVGNVKPWGFWRTIELDCAYFEPYRYTREGNQSEWWKTAGKRSK